MVFDLFPIESPRFQSVVGNPPFQLGEGRNSQVYGNFYLSARDYSEYLSLVFPQGWQTSAPNGPNSSCYSAMREDSQLAVVDNYPESEPSRAFFPTAATGGVNIVLKTPRVKPDLQVEIFEQGKFRERAELVPCYYSLETQLIFDKLQEFMEQRGLIPMSKRISSRGFGVNTFVTTDVAREDYSYLNDSEEQGVRLWSREAGSSRYRWFSLSKDYPPLKLAQLDCYKVAWVKMNASTNWRKTKILRPGEIYSDTFIGVFFDSEEHARNFQSYFSTFFYRFMVSESAVTWSAMPIVHRFVPDVSKLMNVRTGKIGWNSDWKDDDLKVLFKDVLTEDDWDYIEKVAIESDPAALKRNLR